MLLDSIMGAAALDTTFGKGLALMRAGKVDVFDITYDEYDESAHVSAFVEGSSGSDYAASVVLEMAAGRVRSYSCVCPAAHKYGGMCKHATATALAYLDSIGMLGAASSPAVKRAAAVAPARKPEPITSYAIEDLMSRYAAQVATESETLALEAQEEREPALEPADLSCIIGIGEGSYSNRYVSNETWNVGLRITRGKASYVVKYIDEVVHAWRGNRLYSYGKNLAFVHRRAAFTEHANAILDMLAPIVDAQWALHTARDNRYYSQPGLSTKTLPLSTAQLGQLLDLCVGSSVEIDTLERSRYRRRQAGKRSKNAIPVVEGDPALQVTIEPSAIGGYDLLVSNGSMECVMAGGRVYLIAADAICRCSAGFSAEMGAFCASLLPAHEVLHIRDSDMPKFCASVLPALRKHAKLRAPDDLWELMPPVAEFEFRIGEENGFVFCQGVVSYDGQTLDLFEPACEGQPVRHVAREIAAQRVVSQFFPKGRHATPNYAFPRRAGYSRAGLPTWDDGRTVDGSYGAYGAYGSEGAAPTRSLPPFPFFDEDDDTAYYLLFTDGLRELAKHGDVLLSERLRNVEVRQAPSVRVDASVKSGLLDIAVESPDMSPAELVTYLASYRRRQRYVRLGNGDIVLLDGSVGALADLADGLGVEASDLVEGVQGVPANRTLFVDAMLKRTGGIRFSRNEGFRAIVRDFETIADADFTAPDCVRDVLRPYQIEGFKWLCTLGKTGFGGILADDMGLGKTLQMIAYFLHERDAWRSKPAELPAGQAAGQNAVENAARTMAVAADNDMASASVSGEEAHANRPLPALVVCPASLVYNWMAELARFAPDLDAVAIVGAKRQRSIVIARACDHDVLVTSYDLMKRDIEAYEGTSFSCVVLDEAQYIKNSATKVAKAAKQLDARVRFALTGTPIENRLSELWSIFDFLMPGVLGSADSFARRFSGPIAAKEEGAAKRLQGLVGPFILRRLKGDVLQDLPEKNENIVFAEMEGEQAKLYRATSDKLALTLADQMPEEFASSKIEILAELTKLRQLCCDPHLLYENYTAGSAKLETCMELVRSAVEGGHALLLFSQFTSMLDLIAERLRAEKVDYFMLTGATSKEERAMLVERFQAGEASVFLISLKAGGVGLNLTAADIVIHYDPWWNLAAQNQATDRAHRIGQTRDVSVFKLIAKNTIEEKIVELQESKRDLAESVLGGEVVSASTITRDDLLALLEA